MSEGLLRSTDTILLIVEINPMRERALKLNLLNV